MSRQKWLPIGILALTCTGCREDMQIQPKYTPLIPSSFFADGRAARPIPEGTVVFGDTRINIALNDGTINGAFVTSIPVPITSSLLKRGQERFDIFCSPCHGRTGDGQGMIAERGFKIPSDLGSDRVRNAPPGYIYQVIMNGYGAMDDYAYQIQNPQDRWAIVAYIRALQLSRAATMADVPERERARLEAQR